jgi:Ni2+-binding GTPase involved in maturation of urease and hydrogenase
VLKIADVLADERFAAHCQRDAVFEIAAERENRTSGGHACDGGRCIPSRATKHHQAEGAGANHGVVQSPRDRSLASQPRVGDSVEPRERITIVRGDRITTGTVRHLDAEMIAAAIEAWDLASLDVLFVENVGNLVCPASYDLGEALRVVLLSVTEGDDKPLKYPTIFNSADLAVITEIDLASAVGFDGDAVRRAGSLGDNRGRPVIVVRSAQGDTNGSRDSSSLYQRSPDCTPSLRVRTGDCRYIPRNRRQNRDREQDLSADQGQR